MSKAEEKPVFATCVVSVSAETERFACLLQIKDRLPSIPPKSKTFACSLAEVDPICVASAVWLCGGVARTSTSKVPVVFPHWLVAVTETS